MSEKAQIWPDMKKVNHWTLMTLEATMQEHW